MKQSGIKAILDLAKQARANGHKYVPMFSGPPGVGKSEICQEWVNDQRKEDPDFGFIDLRCANLEAPDFIGFPVPTVVDGRQVCAYYPPEFWPSKGSGLLLLDEVNRANSSVMNCLMQLLTDRKVMKYHLPEGWIIASCINEGPEYETNPMDPAFRDRFEIFYVKYDKKDFMKFMKKAEFDPTIQLFVESDTWQYEYPENIGNTAGTKYISPRTFSKLNAAVKTKMTAKIEMDVYEANLGKNVANAFFQFKNNDYPVTYKELVNATDAAIIRLKRFCLAEDYRSGHISITIKNILEEGTDISNVLLTKICNVLPADAVKHLVEQLEFKRKDPTILATILSENKDLAKKFKAIIKKD